MERLVCIDLPAFPLQLLLKRRPAWEGFPVVIVEDDRPHAMILWANEKARAQNILPGMRHNAALALDNSVRATMMPAKEIVLAVSELARRLERHSARVEPSPDTPGVFWLSGRGLKGLYTSVNDWVEAIRVDIAACGFEARICTGFTRFGTWAVARMYRDPVLFRTFEEEQVVARRTPLRALDIDPQFRDTMRRLGIETVGALCDLPSEGIQARYGKEIARLHLMARGDLMPPLESWKEEEPPHRDFHFDFGLRHREQLVFVFKGALFDLLEELRVRGEGVDRMTVLLHFDRPRRNIAAANNSPGWDPRRLELEIRSAESTLDERVLTDLIRLKLESVTFSGAIDEAKLTLHGAPLQQEQTELFGSRRRRDTEAALRGLARVRAEFGEDSVQTLQVAEGHLPEARIACERLENLTFSTFMTPPQDTLIRRILQKPERLEDKPRHHRNDGWNIRGERAGSVQRLLGPYIISGGWWNVAIKRSYHFAETSNGQLLWVYFDHMRKSWFLHGTVD